MVYSLSEHIVYRKAFMLRKVLDMRRNVLGYSPSDINRVAVRVAVVAIKHISREAHVKITVE